MNIHELSTYNLADAVKFHNRLNPRLFGRDEQLLPVVREKLLEIAADFQEFLGVDDLQIKDITLSGSNAAYSYTPHSDIDLHLVVEQPDDEVYRELFDAKKYQYNDEHNITIGGYDVELYVQDADKPHISQGIYSVLNDEWISVPKRRRAKIDDMSVQHKYEDIGRRVEQAIDSNDLERVSATIEKVKQIRKAGLEENGEFGPENLAYKMLRKQGYIQRLFDRRNELKDQELSLNERKKKNKKKFRYGAFGGYWYPGFGYAGQDHAAGSEGGGDGGGESIREASTPDGVSPSTKMFLSETPGAEEVVTKFIQYVAKRLGIEKMPEIELHSDPEWSKGNTSFGRFDPDTHTLHVSLPNRHILDIMRTTAHELAHCRQHEIEPLPLDAGETGSDWENEAHAVAGIIMRDFTDAYPEYFEKESVDESFKSKLAAGALTAALASGGAQAQDLTIGHALAGALNVARATQALKNMGWAGAQEDLNQEIKNYSRALGGDPQAQNQSWLYRTQKRQGTLPQQPQPQSAEQAAADFEAYKQDYYRKKAEFDKQFQKQQQNEGASGYIPTKAQAKDPRYVMALTKDIRPGQVGKEANKMALKTDSQGRPGLLMKTANLREGLSLQERLEQELAKLAKDDPYEFIDPRNKPAPSNQFGMNGHVDEDYDADHPPGPESKPTMPKGTLRVDVSDMYDWYKLGTHISNMKGLGKHDFGAGPPSTIVSFGDEETEHKFIGDLEATGLDVTDIDPVDPKKRPGKKVKTDPTYNVNESRGTPEVYLDMDGVLADFLAGYNRLAGTQYTANNQIPHPSKDPMLKKLQGSDFFSTLPKFDSADALVKMVVERFGHYNICSSPLRNDYENSATNKHIWLKSNLRPSPRQIIITPRKEKYAVQADGTPNVLVDDKPENIERWKAAGGIGILYDASRDSLDKVARGLALNENFADGKIKGKSRPGRVKRAGASCDGSVTDLRKRAKAASGEKAKMYHWCANMKSGRKK